MRKLGLGATFWAALALSAPAAFANCMTDGRVKSGSTACVMESIGGKAVMALAVCSPDGSWRTLRGSDEGRVWCPCEYNGARFSTGAVLGMGEPGQRFRCAQGLWRPLEERGAEATAAAGSPARTGSAR